MKQAEGYIKSFESIIIKYGNYEAFRTMMLSGTRFFGEEFKAIVRNYFDENEQLYAYRKWVAEWKQ